MAYQQTAQAELARGMPPPTDPFVLRTHGETNEAGGRFMYVELADAPGSAGGTVPVAGGFDPSTASPSASRGRKKSGSRRSGSPSPQGERSGSSRRARAPAPRAAPQSAPACPPGADHRPPRAQPDGPGERL